MKYVNFLAFGGIRSLVEGTDEEGNNADDEDAEFVQVRSSIRARVRSRPV